MIFALLRNPRNVTVQSWLAAATVDTLTNTGEAAATTLSPTGNLHQHDGGEAAER